MRVLNEYGVEIELESGDLFYKVNKQDFQIFHEVLTNFFEPDPNFVYYASELAAKNYVYWNKPIYSRNNANFSVSPFNAQAVDCTACIGCGTPIYNGFCLCEECNKLVNN
jgi:hypothetical protein